MHRKAILHLKGADPKLAAVIERVGPCRFEPNADGAHFDHIARAIVYQQLSGKAAGTIFARFKALYGDRVPTPPALFATADDALRAVGLSRQKIGYLRSLAETVEQGALAIDRLHELTDEEILGSLVRVKGIGRWTAQMFLMFRLGRPDVLPELDLGIQKAIQRAYGLRALPKPDRVKKIGAKWSPYATVASWYLWRSLDQ
jgi:DNA-3-methyladenine glycosylase II